MLAIAPVATSAEEIELRSGARFQVPVEADGSTVSIRVGREVFRLPSSDVRIIGRGGLPEDQWPVRREKALRGTSRDRFAAAWWAMEHGLTSESESMLRRTHADDPSLEIASRLVRVSDRLSATSRPPEPGRLESLRPLNLKQSESEHILLFHHVSEGNAAERLALMEQVLRTFYLTFTGLGFDLRMPREKLLAVCFSAEADYSEFLRNADAGTLTNTRGYYHPTLHLTVTFDTSPDRLDRSDSAAMVREIDRRRVEFGTLAHELIHQLVAESRLAPRYESFPIWLHEGLAMQFETVRDGRWTGLDPINDTRLAHWHACRSVPRLAPLLHEVGFGHGYNSDRYAQAWGLLACLRVRHPSAFVAVLDAARLPDDLPWADRSDRLTSALLRATSLDLLPLEQAWRSYLRTLSRADMSELPRNPRR
jgi:hypothetical protein